MSKVLAICNRKGGSGKTTTAVNLSAALAHRGRSVLLVDADSQAHSSLSFGFAEHNGHPDLAALLQGKIRLEGVIGATYHDRLKVIPASKGLFVYERDQGRDRSALGRLGDELRSANGTFDYVIIDTPPILGHMTVSALLAADEVIVPTQTHYLSMEGLAELISAASRVGELRERPLPVSGVVPTFFNARTRISRTVLDEIRKLLGDSSILGPVRSNIALAEAPAFGQTIYQYDARSNGAHDYMRVAAQIEERNGQ